MGCRAYAATAHTVCDFAPPHRQVVGHWGGGPVLDAQYHTRIRSYSRAQFISFLNRAHFLLDFKKGGDEIL